MFAKLSIAALAAGMLATDGASTALTSPAAATATSALAAFATMLDWGHNDDHGRGGVGAATSAVTTTMAKAGTATAVEMTTGMATIGAGGTTRAPAPSCAAMVKATPSGIGTAARAGGPTTSTLASEPGVNWVPCQECLAGRPGKSSVVAGW